MPYLVEGLSALVAITLTLIAVLVARPRLTAGRGGKAVAFIALFVLPVALTSLALGAHLDHSKSTEFCLSCHVMEPYGESLQIDSLEHVPASHFQNNRVPRERACFTCHTTYTMFGDLEAKIQGLRHVWVYYTGQTPEKIELYQPYHNRECLSCHGVARAYLESELHLEVMAELESNEMSCLECHEPSHDVENLAELELWSGQTP